MSAAERKLRSLKNRKRSILSSMSAIKSFLTSYQADKDKREVPVRLENLIALWAEFNTVEGELESLEEDDDVLEAFLKERTEVERLYYKVKGTLLQLNENDSMPVARPLDTNQVSHVKLPDIKLPIFDGNFESWLNFHDLFESLVHTSTSLSTIQKFYYLRSSLAGEALKLIQTIPITNEQYAVAWNLLVSHYQNTRRLKRTYVQSLFEFPCMKRETAVDLHTLIDKFQANVKILKQLGEQTEHWDVFLIHLLSTRLDTVTRRDWEEYAEANNTTKFQQLIEFLQRRVNVLETVSGNSAETSAPAKKPIPPRSASYGASLQGSRQCPACSGQHSLYQCGEFSEMTVDEKDRVVRRNQLCRNCLRRGHIAKECNSESNCRKCRGRHHTQLCYASRSEGSNQLLPIVQSSQQGSSNDQLSSTPAVHTGITSCTSLDRSRTKVLLATAVVIMVDDNGKEYPVRALLDSGSECCFVTERVVQQMRVRRSNVNLPIAGIGESATEVRCKIQSTIKSRVSNYFAKIEAFVLPRVTVDLPSISVDASSWSLPTGIHLADPSFYQSGTIDVVLGAEVFFDLFTVPGRIPLGESFPCLVNSVFGWVISGKTPQGQSGSPMICNVATTTDLQRYMARINECEVPAEPACVLPHHPVIYEDSYTSKIDVASDASCKNAALNDLLLVLPNVQEEIRGISEAIDPKTIKATRKTSHASTPFVKEYVGRFRKYQYMQRMTAYWRRYFRTLHQCVSASRPFSDVVFRRIMSLRDLYVTHNSKNFVSAAQGISEKWEATSKSAQKHFVRMLGDRILVEHLSNAVKCSDPNAELFPCRDLATVRPRRRLRVNSVESPPMAADSAIYL